jgi:flagellar basal-body rod protein FlgC
MAAHRAEMDLIAANIANAGASRAEGGAPYRPRKAVFEPSGSASFASVLADASSDALDGADGDFDFEASPISGVRLAGVIESEASAPDGDPIEQMVSLVSAGRAYDADVAALQAAKQMDVEAIEVDRP